MSKNKKTIRRVRIKRRIRKRLSGTAARPRLTVFRSNQHIYAQLVDDIAGVTLASASTREKGAKPSGARVEQSKEVGKRLAERAKEAGIATAVFDRNGFRYHGRVKALAEGVREGGLTV